MVSNSSSRAIALVTALLTCACSTPWKEEPVNDEVNLSFTLERNLVELTSVRVGGRAGRFILGTAAPATVIDSRFQSAAPRLVSFGERETVRVSPRTADLGGVADAIVGADAWQKRAVTIDYRSGLVTWQKEGIHTGFMHVYRYPAEPAIEVLVDGRPLVAVVDTSSPDTLVLPSSSTGRSSSHVVVAGTDFGTIDVKYADVASARIGNRLLSRFLVTIDYGKRVVGLWRDPRIPLR